MITNQYNIRELPLSDYVSELEACSIDLPWATPDDPPLVALPAKEVEPIARAGTWQCIHCGEDSPASFDRCWNCGAELLIPESGDDGHADVSPSEIDRLKKNETNPFGTMEL